MTLCRIWGGRLTWGGGAGRRLMEVGSGLGARQRDRHALPPKKALSGHQNTVQSLLVNGTLAYADILAAFPSWFPLRRCRRRERFCDLGNWPDGSLDDIGVDLDAAVVEKADKPLPVAQPIANVFRNL